jgi:hypothetical protein
MAQEGRFVIETRKIVLAYSHPGEYVQPSLSRARRQPTCQRVMLSSSNLGGISAQRAKSGILLGRKRLERGAYYAGSGAVKVYCARNDRAIADYSEAIAHRAVEENGRWEQYRM